MIGFSFLSFFSSMGVYGGEKGMRTDRIMNNGRAEIVGEQISGLANGG